jgi:hypothetical protein
MNEVEQAVAPGLPAPKPGAYRCTAEDCVRLHNVSIKGAPLPPAHHAGAKWRLLQLDEPGT